VELKKNSSLYRKLKARLKELITQGNYHKQLSDENFDKYVRAMADFDNYRKRVAKEYLEKEAEANRNLIAKLLPVLDNLDRAIEVSRNGAESDEALKSFHQGVQLIDQQIHNILENEGLKPFSSKGEEFDPARHDAVLSVETNEHEPNKVLDEVEKGFVFKGKVLRHARVTVSKRPGGEPEEPNQEYPEGSDESQEVDDNQETSE
jgi:molecular chaperone GrpE